MTKSVDKSIDLVGSIVKVEARASSSSLSETLHQGLCAVGAGADRDTFLIEHLSDIEGVNTLYPKRDSIHRERLTTMKFDAFDRLHLREGSVGQRLCVCVDRPHPDRVEIVDRCV